MSDSHWARLGGTLAFGLPGRNKNPPGNELENNNNKLSLLQLLSAVALVAVANATGIKLRGTASSVGVKCMFAC